MDAFDNQYISECLEVAGNKMRGGNVTGAVRSAIDGLVRFFDKEFGSRRRRAKQAFVELHAEWPKRGIHIRYDGGLSVSYERNTFDIETGNLYCSFIYTYVSRWLLAPPRLQAPQSLCQSGLIFTRYTASQLPRNWRRARAALTSARLCFLERTSDGTVQCDKTIGMIGEFLSEPRKQARVIYRNFLAYQSQRTAQKRDVERDALVGTAIQAAMTWPGESDYVEFIRRDNRSRLLTSLHLGNAPHAMLRISSHSAAGRRVIQLRRGDGLLNDEATKRQYEQQGIQFETSRNGERSTLELLGALRKGNTTISALFDLNGNFGETTRVSFMGRPAYFVRGPVELAIIARIPILPFVTYFDQGRDHIQIQDLIETKLLPKEPLQDGVQRLTQTLVGTAERWIRKFPHQWLFLQSANSYNNDFRQ